MNSLVWRGRSRFVAYLDLALLFLSFGMVGAYGVFLAKGKVCSRITDDIRTYWLFVSIMVMVVLCIVMQVYAAIKLLAGTEIVADMQVALKNSKLWKNSSIVFMFVIATANFLLLGLLPMLIEVVIRLCMNIVVFQFIRELQISPKAKTFVVPYAI